MGLGPIKLTSILDALSDFAGIFGYQTDSGWKSMPEVFSLRGILGLMGLVMAAAVVFATVRLFKRWDKLKFEARILLLTFVFCVAFQSFIFATFAGGYFTGARYWLTCLPLAFAVIQMEIDTENFRYTISRKVTSVGFLFCIACTSAASILTFIRTPVMAKTELKPLCDWLVEQGYTQGYATFWFGNVLTEWSNNQLDVWVTEDLTTAEPKRWLQYTSHDTAPEGKVFLVTDKNELETFGIENLYGADNMVYENHSGYLVFDFDSREQMLEQIQEVKATT